MELSTIIDRLKGRIETRNGAASIIVLKRIESEGLGSLDELPYSIRILLENVIRYYDGYVVRDEDVEAVAGWTRNAGRREIPFHPTRVIMQDFTGVPAIVDLASMRDAVAKYGVDPSIVNPLIPVDLIIDHSLQVDYYATDYAFRLNLKKEYERNK